jgi:hypothetical protein
MIIYIITLQARTFYHVFVLRAGQRIWLLYRYRVTWKAKPPCIPFYSYKTNSSAVELIGTGSVCWNTNMSVNKWGSWNHVLDMEQLNTVWNKCCCKNIGWALYFSIYFVMSGYLIFQKERLEFVSLLQDLERLCARCSSQCATVAGSKAVAAWRWLFNCICT